MINFKQQQKKSKQTRTKDLMDNYSLFFYISLINFLNP
jgi:hypothetical protein